MGMPRLLLASHSFLSPVPEPLQRKYLVREPSSLAVQFILRTTALTQLVSEEVYF